MKLQKIVVFVNETANLAHVGIYNMTNYINKSNRNSTIPALFEKARSSVKNIGKDYVETQFMGKFSAAILNTKQEDWKISRVFENIEVTAGLKLRDQLREEYSKTYQTSGFCCNKIVNVHSVKSGPNVELKNATQAKIYKIVEDLSTGLKLDLEKTKRMIYREYAVRQTLKNRRDFWQFIQDNMNTLQVELSQVA